MKEQDLLADLLQRFKDGTISDELLQLCMENNCFAPKTFAEDADFTVAAVFPFLYTWAILADINQYGYVDRWCYKSLDDCLAALQAWDGHGEPTGWHRHPTTGRRRDEHGNEHVAF